MFISLYIKFKHKDMKASQNSFGIKRLDSELEEVFIKLKGKEPIALSDFDYESNAILLNMFLQLRQAMVALEVQKMINN